VLAHAAPSEVVRYGLPEGTRLHTTDVVVPREDLPRRWAVTTPIGVTSLVLPTPPNAKGLRDAWVVLLRPYHTFFVASGDDLDEAVRHELLRLCAAQELTPAQYLGLLPLRAETLVPLRIDFERGVAASASRAADGKRRVAEAEARKAAIAVLDSIAEPLHTALGHGERPFPLRDAERELLGRLLGGDERASVLLVGPERVGKTGLFRALAASLTPRGRIIIIVSTPEIYWHEWASFSTRDFPENRGATSGDLVRIVMLDVPDRRPVEDIVCTDASYREVFAQAGLAVLESRQPLGRADEPQPWVSETRVAPWSIYVLGRSAVDPPRQSGGR
jgi:hypothetical protein